MMQAKEILKNSRICLHIRLNFLFSCILFGYSVDLGSKLPFLVRATSDSKVFLEVLDVIVARIHAQNETSFLSVCSEH